MLLGLLAAAAGGLVAASLLALVAGRLPAGGAPVARRRVVLVALTAPLFGAVVVAHADDGAEIVLGLALVGLLTVVTVIEIASGRLPDAVLAAAAVAAVGLGVLVDAGGEVERLLAAVAAGVLMLLVALARPGATGMDGVKLAAVLGLFLGREVVVAVLIAVAAGIIAGIVTGRREDVAERPVSSGGGACARMLLASGAVGALLFGGPLVDTYLAAF